MFDDESQLDNESSIDGELEEILKKNGIKTSAKQLAKSSLNTSDIKINSNTKKQKGFDIDGDDDEEEEFNSSVLDTNMSFHVDGLNDINMLLPACLKLNSILNSHG